MTEQKRRGLILFSSNDLVRTVTQPASLESERRQERKGEGKTESFLLFELQHLERTPEVPELLVTHTVQLNRGSCCHVLSEALSFINKSRNHFHTSLFILVAPLVCSFVHTDKEVLGQLRPSSLTLPSLYFLFILN